MVWLEWLGQLKNPMTSLGIEPVTFRLVVKCLNQLCYYVASKLKEFHTELIRNTILLYRLKVLQTLCCKCHAAS
jgi:hypothetical protein